jgi:hypothetical protein
MVSWTVLDLGPTFFLQRILDNVGPNHFYVALSKSPVMAAVVASIGCRQGLLVGGDVHHLEQAGVRQGDHPRRDELPLVQAFKGRQDLRQSGRRFRRSIAMKKVSG